MSANHQFAGIAANIDIKTVGDADLNNYHDCVLFAQQHEPITRVDSYREWALASNVRLRYPDNAEGYFAIVLYRTEIVRYYPDDTFSVDNGGFNTPTTARRVAQFTPRGYGASHHKKKLELNGQPTGHDVRFPTNKENN